MHELSVNQIAHVPTTFELAGFLASGHWSLFLFLNGNNERNGMHRAITKMSIVYKILESIMADNPFIKCV